VSSGELAETHPTLDELIGLARIGGTGAAGLETGDVLAVHVRDQAGPAVPVDLLLGGAVGSRTDMHCARASNLPLRSSRCDGSLPERMSDLAVP